MNYQKICPNCLQNVDQNARFCKFCGYLLSIKNLPSTLKNEMHVILPPHIISVLEKKISFKKINKEKARIKNEIYNIEKEFNNRSTSIYKIEQKIEKLKKELQIIRQKEQEIKSSMKKLPIEKLIKLKNDMKMEFTKLNNKFESGEISEISYHKFTQEINEKIRGISSQIREELDKLKYWISQLTLRIKNYEQATKMLHTKLEINEVNMKKYENLEDNTDKITRFKEYLEILKSEYTRIREELLT